MLNDGETEKKALFPKSLEKIAGNLFFRCFWDFPDFAVLVGRVTGSNQSGINSSSKPFKPSKEVLPKK